MKRDEPLKIPKGDRVKNLRPWCKECSSTISDGKCRKTKKRIASCEFPHKHTYKVYFTVPGTRNERTKELATKDLAEAIKERDKFKQRLIANDYQSSANHKSKKKKKPLRLLECMAWYVAELNNVGVPKHKQVNRSQKYINQCETDFRKMCEALKKNNIDYAILKVDHMNDDIVGMIHDYILKDLGHSNKTYNKMMSFYRRFIDWLIKSKGYSIENYFVGIKNRYTEGNTEIVSQDEFNTFLQMISSDQGWRVFPSGRKKYLYRPWLSACYRLAIETGLRNEEFMKMKFSHIGYDEKGKPLYIEVPNYKVNRIKGEETAIDKGEMVARNKKYVPITKGMLQLLEELDYKNLRGTDAYLIGNDEKVQRSTMVDIASKGFTHYWTLTGSKRVILLKNLRKTYLTSLSIQLGDKANIVSDHSDIDVIKENYQNRKYVVSMVQNFSVFDYKPITASEKGRGLFY